MTKSLYDEMRSENNLFAAWRHVKKSALKSKNSTIRGQATEFERNHQRHLRRIGVHLRNEKFVFDKSKGVLKDKKEREAVGKNPRPIAISSIKNRIAQRAILQVLQPRKIRNSKDLDSRYTAISDQRLGKINKVNESKFGVGGLLKPYGGVEAAITTIRNSIDNGSKFFYQSDIKSFFTKIPISNVVDFIRTETRDSKLVNIFEDALQTNLENKDELASYAELFPSDGIGVAQGSSLSSFAGNILLYNLDHELNKGRIVAVRYIDDLLMVSASETDLQVAIDLARTKLQSLGFSLYSPSPGSDKAAEGLCANGISFLGCTIQPNKCVPSKASTQRLKKDIAETLSNSKKGIFNQTRGISDLHPKMSQSAVLQTVGRKMYGWQKSFSFCTEPKPFSDLDKAINKDIENYNSHVHREAKKVDLQVRMKILGIPNLGELFYSDKV